MSRSECESGELRTEFLQSGIEGIVLREDCVYLDHDLILAWILRPRISSIRARFAELSLVHV